MVFGHSQLVNDFKNLAAVGRLAHGYIFFGEPDVGKFYFAKHLANLLENAEFSIPVRPMQDSLILENAEGIDAMRELKSFLWQKPAISSKRMAIVNNAENLTLQAQNAILKIAEEPPESVMIILIVNQLENLLPPLLSRMQKIHFGRLSNSEIEKGFVWQAGISDKKIIDFSFGRPGRAARLLSDSLTKEADDYAKKFLASVGFNRSKLIKELVDLQRDLTDKEGKDSMLLDYFFESLILKLHRDPIINAPILKSVLHRLFLIKSYNVNKRLQLEAI